MATKQPTPDYVQTVTLTDGRGESFVVDVEIRAAILAQALGAYARENGSKVATSCARGVIVRYVREAP